MSKLHKSMVALGDLKDQSYESIAAACGEPKELRDCEFTDIGKGRRATWSDGRFTITLNFDSEGRYCGIYHHRNWEPYIWIGAFTVLVVAAALIVGAYMRRGAGELGTPEALSQSILEQASVWRNEDTAGASVMDTDGDGQPELVAVDTQIKYYEELDGYYFGGSSVRIYDIDGETLRQKEGYDSGSYCFSLRIETPAGERRAMQNESWISPSGEAAPEETVQADILAMAEAYFAENQE